jgi:hypothetical protein
LEGVSLKVVKQHCVDLHATAAARVSLSQLAARDMIAADVTTCKAAWMSDICCRMPAVQQAFLCKQWQ